jgi:NADH-quinone oxidoreductase subunit L
MTQLAWLILLAPAIAFVLIGLFTLRWKNLSSFITIAAIGLSFVLSWLVLFSVGAGAPEGFQWQLVMPWLAIGDQPAIPLSFGVDRLSAVMLVVVTTVSFLVQVYSRGYMHGDPGFSRYFAFMALFTFSMLGLVLAGNLLTIFIFWELVGLSSYLLIGFWYHKTEAADAAKKAFVTTRFGDFGFLLGILLLWAVANPKTLEFAGLAQQVQAHQIPEWAVTLGALLLFAGAVGKSAQFPLHVWLPDAMEGPTPVSALIHAATMVAAGVYLVARAFPIFAGSETAMLVVAGIGSFTALFAGTMALVNNDIKRVVAFSTVSQLGYMMLGLGAFSQVAGMFHLFTHAFFKALLFLGSGSVIHATETQDLREMGGLRRAMPITFWTMLLASLSLAGIFPLAGFWSKDEILLVTMERATHGEAYAWLYMLFLAFAIASVFLTAFYTFRLIFMAFFGRYRGHHHPHESPPVMAIPLILLAIPAVVAGFWGSPYWPAHGFGGYLDPAHAHEAVINWGLAGLSLVLALAGIGLAFLMYVRGAPAPVSVGRAFGPLYNWAYHRWYLDELYNWLISRIVLAGSRATGVFDLGVIDGIVNGVGRLVLGIGGSVRQVQTGRLQGYGLALFGGLAVIAIALIFLPGTRP